MKKAERQKQQAKCNCVSLCFLVLLHRSLFTASPAFRRISEQLCTLLLCCHHLHAPCRWILLVLPCYPASLLPSQPTRTRCARDAPSLLPRWLKHVKVNVRDGSAHSSEIIRGSKVPHSCRLLCLFVRWVTQVSTFLKFVRSFSRAGRCRALCYKLLIAAINHFFDLQAVDYSSCSRWWDTRSLTCTSISLSSFQIFTRTKNFPPEYQNRLGSAINIADRKANTIKRSIKFYFTRGISGLRILLVAKSLKGLKVDITQKQTSREHSSFLKFSM